MRRRLAKIIVFVALLPYLGVVAVIAANALNMALRIISSGVFLRGYLLGLGVAIPWHKVIIT
jgi:uncharacterized membrane protein (DUF485 family)